MSQINRHNIFLAISIFLVSCEIGSDEELSELYILEAYLYSGEDVKNIKVSRLVTFNAPEDFENSVNDASIVLSKNGELYPLILSSGDSGYYHYPSSGLTLNINDEVGIVVEIGNTILTSSAIVPQEPEDLNISETEIVIPPISSPRDLFQLDIPEIEVFWNNPNREHYFIVVENTEEEPLEIFEGDFPQRNFRFVSEPTQDDFYIVRPPSLTQYGVYSVRVFKVNQEYVDLYETAEQDSRFLTEPSSNVENGLGIFTIFSYREILFEVKQ